MAPRSRDSDGASRPERRILVEDGGTRRPFMRGILIHSLMARGLSFDEAFRAANEIRDQIRDRGVVSRLELAELAEQVLGDKPPGDEVRPADLPPPIRVVREGKGTPFSKGFIAQSLRAAAIDPQDAFEVAQDIERDLRRRGLREIDRTELRRIAHGALRDRLGPQAAERYMVWRKFQQSDRPLILLLGGTSGAGKTSLALEVSNRLGIHRVASTDSIRQIMRLTLSPDLVPLLHTSSYEAHRVLPAGAGNQDRVVEGFLGQASIVSVGVRAMIDRAVEENTSLIMDGVSIVPGMIDLDAYAERAHVVFLVVATLDVDAFRARFAARGIGENGRPPHRYLENLDSILRIQDHILELAEQHGVPIVVNESFDASVLSILRHVTETLRAERGFDASDPT
jgi:2-phosphoglycerate kinase